VVGHVTRAPPPPQHVEDLKHNKVIVKVKVKVY
jgi:hypothetical protein